MGQVMNPGKRLAIRSYIPGGYENKSQLNQEKAAGLTRVVNPLEEAKRKTAFIKSLTAARNVSSSSRLMNKATLGG